MEQVIEFFRSSLEGVHFDDPVQRELYLRDGIRQLSRFVAVQEREDPPAVLQTERGFDMKLGRVLVRGRIDRVDRLGGGHVAIIKATRPERHRLRLMPIRACNFPFTRWLRSLSGTWLPNALFSTTWWITARWKPAAPKPSLRLRVSKSKWSLTEIARGEFDPQPTTSTTDVSIAGFACHQQDVALPSPARITEN